MTGGPILAIDTSSNTASVAVYADQVLAETTWHSGRRHSAETVFPSILEDEGDRGCEARSAFIGGPALSIRARNLGAVADKPFAVPLDDRSEFVPHA